METENVFKTKTGYCHILPDKIVLSRDGIVGNLASVVSGNTIYQSIILYSVLIVYFSYLFIHYYTAGSYPIAAIYGAFILFFLYYTFRAFGYSMTPVIERKSIQHIRFKKAIPFVSRSYFEITFLTAKGKTKKRMILLPGTLTSGEETDQKALEIMRSEHLIND